MGETIKIRVNGKQISLEGSPNNITFRNGQVISDGEIVSEFGEGETICIDKIEGNIGLLVLNYPSVINGDIHGNVRADGPINCGDINGHLKADGPVNCGKERGKHKGRWSGKLRKCWW